MLSCSDVLMINNNNQFKHTVRLADPNAFIDMASELNLRFIEYV